MTPVLLDNLERGRKQNIFMLVFFLEGGGGARNVVRKERGDLTL